MLMPHWSRGLGLGVLLASLGLLAAGRAAAQPEAVSTALAAIVGEAQHPWLRWPRFPNFREELDAIYRPRAFAPLWLEQGRPTSQAGEAIAMLAGAASHGLDPADYDAALLEQERRRLAARAPAPAGELAHFDAALSIGVLRYVSHLHVGKLNPRNVTYGLDAPPHRIDRVALVSEAVQAGRIREAIQEAEPENAMYRRLLRVLAEYRALAADASLSPPRFAETLHPGGSSDAVPALARHLAALRDLPEATPASGDLLYTDDLVAAVIRFQTRHGLEPDGVIGRETQRALDVPLASRVRQIELSLERLRWVPDLPPARFVIVNVPAFELVVRDSLTAPEESALSMRVVVGKAGRTPTPVFIAAMRTVVFGPYWNVPRSILVNEMLPKIRRDPGYLATEHLEIVSGEGLSVLPSGPESIGRLAAGTAWLRQRPGLDNALGSIKFLFPNRYNVYLHDTPAQQIFRKSRRDFSHGCVRVEDPLGLAEWVLRDRPEWDRESILRAMATAHDQWVPLSDPIFVMVFYTTVIARTDGSVFFYDDLYGHDAKLASALAGGEPYLR